MLLQCLHRLPAEDHSRVKILLEFLLPCLFSTDYDRGRDEVKLGLVRFPSSLFTLLWCKPQAISLAICAYVDSCVLTLTPIPHRDYVRFPRGIRISLQLYYTGFSGDITKGGRYLSHFQPQFGVPSLPEDVSSCSWYAANGCSFILPEHGVCIHV